MINLGAKNGPVGCNGLRYCKCAPSNLFDPAFQHNDTFKTQNLEWLIP